MKYDLLQQIFNPKIALCDIEDVLRKIIQDPVRIERAVGTMYGNAFRLAEKAYAARGSKGRHPW